MKRLIAKIKAILRNRKTRKMWMRVISVTAAIVVFVTTYALVLPAITMEKTADCGIEEHQHDDSCYEMRLVCGLEESEEHHHTDACYEKVLTCTKEVHTHSAACYHSGGVYAAAGEVDPVDESVSTDQTNAFAEEMSGETVTGQEQYAEETAGEESDSEAGTYSDSVEDGLEAETGATASAEDQIAADEGTDTSLNENPEGAEVDAEASPSEGQVAAEEGTDTSLNENPEGAEVDAEASPSEGQVAAEGDTEASPSEGQVAAEGDTEASPSEGQVAAEVDTGASSSEGQQGAEANTDSVSGEGQTGAEAGTDDTSASSATGENPGTDSEISAEEDTDTALGDNAALDSASGKTEDSGSFTNTDSATENAGEGNQTDTSGSGATDMMSAGENPEDISNTKILNSGNVETSAVLMPAMSFSDTIRVSTGKPSDVTEGTGGAVANAAEKLPEEADVLVRVEADEGTFPAGTMMQLSPVEDIETVEKTITETVETADSSVDKDIDAGNDGGDGKSSDADQSTEKKNPKTYGFQAVDITFLDKDGNTIEPAKPVRVSLTSEVIEQIRQGQESGAGLAADPVVVHMDDNGNGEQMALMNPEDVEPAQGRTEEELLREITSEENAQSAATLPAEEPSDEAYAQTQTEDTGADDSLTAENVSSTVSFEADSFSVYAIVYTVDFHWEVNGKKYDFSIPGGGATSFCDLVKALGIVTGTGETDEGSADAADTSDTVKEFVADVENLQFSDPELIWVGRIEEKSTVGQIKENNGIESRYSADQNAEEIEKINNTWVESGDWALISLLPFKGEETLTVTMKNGEQFVIKVTDAQISTYYLNDKGECYEVTVTYGDDAQIPDGSTLKITEFEEDSEKYLEARKAVIAEKISDGKEVDPAAMGFSALDISILNAEGKEIEPAAPVTVDMTIKALPGVDELSSVESTLAVQHHVETEKGVVLETVFDGSAEASFTMDTDEAVAAGGTPVDPYSVDLSEYEVSENENETKNNSNDTAPDETEVIFDTPLFSTFTVTWDARGAFVDPAPSVFYLYTTAAGVNAYQFSDDGSVSYNSSNTNNLYFMDSDGYLVSGGAVRSASNGIASGDLYLVYTKKYNAEGDGTVSEADSTFHIYFKNNGNTYADVTVHYVDREGNNIKRTQTQDVTYNGGSVDTRYATGDNSKENLSDYAGDKSGYSNPQVIYKRTDPLTGPNATIHYVDEDRNELTVVHTTPSAVTGSPNYLIYDVEGYEYSYTYLNSESNKIQPELVYVDTGSWMSSNYKWCYYKDNNYYTSSFMGKQYNTLSEDDDIYVVYKKKTTPTDGGTPLIDTTASQPDDPNILKTSTENGNGTNTLSLSITGSRNPSEQIKLADVIVVFDRSGSMNYNMSGETLLQQYGTAYRYWNENSRIKQAYNAVDQFAETLLSKKNSNGDPLVRMSLVSFSNTATVDHGFTSDKSEFMGALQTLVGDGGTNWEDALYKANTSFTLAEDEDNVGDMELDPNRATFVVFVTDGAPTFRLTRYDVANGSFNENTTNGADGRDISGEMYLLHDVFGPGDADYHGYNYDAALEQASSITQKKKILYSIGISGDESELANLGRLLNEAGAGEGHNVVATTQEKLKEAFDDIAKSILGQFGQANIKMNDGITPLTNIVAKANEEGRLEGVEGNFVYYKADAPEGWSTWTAEQKAAYNQGIKYQGKNENPDGYDNWTDDQKTAFAAGKAVEFEIWEDRKEEGCGEAKFEDGAVVWNMGDEFMLEDGVTYRVSFICWPSQEAYDILAKCRNDESYYDTLTAEQKEQIIRTGTPGNYTYELKTNAADPYTKYQSASENSGLVTTFGDEETIPFQTVPDMGLAERQINVKKDWVNDLDTRSYYKDIRLGIKADGTNFASINLEVAKEWSGSAYISTGLMDVYDGVITLYETGHDFTLVEDEELAYHWELTADIYRPMVITDPDQGYTEPTPVILKRVTSEDEYDYIIEDNYYSIERGNNALTAVNYRRSNLNLVKNIVANNGTTLLNDQHEDELFDFTITINEAKQEDVWFSVLEDPDDNSSIIKDLTTNATAETDDSGNSTGYYHAMSGTQVTVSLKPSWNLRFINLPKGSGFTIVESAKTDYTFYGATISPETGLSVDKNTMTVTGTIDDANTQYVVDFKNQYSKLDVAVEKVWAGQASPGSSTVTLYRVTGTKDSQDDPAVPTNKISVTVNTVPVPVVTSDGSIAVSYTGTGDDGTSVTGSITLDNANGWDHTFTLDRGLEYEFTYTVDGEEVLNVTPDVTGKIIDTTTVTLVPEVKEIPKYTYTFSVNGDRPAKGYIDVTCNGSTQRADAQNNWTVQFEVAQGDVFTYEAVPDGKFVTAVELVPESSGSPVSGDLNINMIPTAEALTMTVPVSVAWEDTPESGTTVTVTFTPDKEGIESTTITLDGSENWNSEVTLDRLDESGDLVTWTVSISDNKDLVEVSTGTDTIQGEGSVDITGSVIPQYMNLTIEAGNSVNSHRLYRVSYDNGEISYTTFDDIGGVPGYNNTSTFNNLPYQDDAGNDLYYGIVVWEGNLNVETDAPFAGYTTSAVENIWTRRTVVYFKAKPGDVTVKLTKGDSWNVEYGVSFNQVSPASVSKFARRLSVSALKSAAPAGSTQKTFYDSSIQAASGDLPFTSIKYKDLPEGAVEVETQVLTGNMSYTWSSLPAADENGNPYYYYVVEKDATTRAETMDVTYRYEYIGDDPVNGISKVTITNTTTCLEPKKTDVTLKKVDKSNVNKEVLTEGDFLDGAKFIIEKYDELSPHEVKDEEWCDAHNELNEGSEGVFTFTDLTAGIYRIVEKEYPDGYIQLSDIPAFEIYVDTDDNLGIRLLNDAGGLVRLDDGEFTLIVGNEPGAELPSTGGPGTRMIYLLGITLIALAGAGFMMKRMFSAQ